MKETQLNQIQLKNAQNEVYFTLDRQEDYIYASWKGHISADEVIAGAKAYLELIRAAPCPKLLNDKSDATGDWQEANDWLEYEWLPQVNAAGLNRMAHVYSYSMFSQLAAQDLQERVTPPLLMKNFMDLDLAKKWLLNCS